MLQPVKLPQNLAEMTPCSQMVKVKEMLKLANALSEESRYPQSIEIYKFGKHFALCCCIYSYIEKYCPICLRRPIAKESKSASNTCNRLDIHTKHLAVYYGNNQKQRALMIGTYSQMCTKSLIFHPVTMMSRSTKLHRSLRNHNNQLQCNPSFQRPQHLQRQQIFPNPVKNQSPTSH